MRKTAHRLQTVIFLLKLLPQDLVLPVLPRDWRGSNDNQRNLCSRLCNVQSSAAPRGGKMTTETFGTYHRPENQNQTFFSFLIRIPAIRGSSALRLN